MSVPPQPTPRDSGNREVAGERPARRKTRVDKAGPALVGLVLVAILVALVLLLLL